MSFDNVGGTTPVLDTEVLLYAGDYGSLPGQGSEVSAAIAALGQSSEDAGSILQSVPNNMDFAAGTDSTTNGAATVGDLDDDDVTPLNVFYENEPIDETGGSGYFEVSEPVIYVPEGFTVNDLYATEFILDTTTGILTVNLCFSTDPADFQVAGSTVTSPLASLASAIDLGLDDPSPLQQGGSKCVVTVTKTTSSTSGTSGFTFLGGLINYTSTSGSTTTTTTRTVTLEGTLKNGRCVVTSSR